MATFILTWNPERWDWNRADYDKQVAATSQGRLVHGSWSTGIRKGGIDPGDRAYLLRQHEERGLVASGRFVSHIYVDEHWDGSGRPTAYADVEWDTVLHVEDRLALETLKRRIPETFWDRMQGSGVQLKDTPAAKLERIWAQRLS